MKEYKTHFASCIAGLFGGIALSQIEITTANAHYGVRGLRVVGLLFDAKMILDYKWKGLLAFLSLALLGVVVEFIGIKTCIPYGCFEYSNLLGPRFNATFPWVLFVIWPTLSLSIAHLVPNSLATLKKIALGAGLLVLLDLFLDPVIVSQGLWSYEAGGWWWGVPCSNFLGWIPMGLVTMSIIFLFLTRKSRQSRFYGSLGLFFFVFYIVQFLLLALG